MRWVWWVLVVTAEVIALAVLTHQMKLPDDCNHDRILRLVKRACTNFKRSLPTGNTNFKLIRRGQYLIPTDIEKQAWGMPFMKEILQIGKKERHENFDMRLHARNPQSVDEKFEKPWSSLLRRYRRSGQEQYHNLVRACCSEAGCNAFDSPRLATLCFV